MRDWCECEHHSHFDKDFNTPNGNPAHDYGKNFESDYLVNVKTPFGTFNVCKDCATDCYSPERMAKLME